MSLTPATYTVPPSGWYVEVDLPDGNGGTVTRTPAVAGDPQWTPSVNHLPRVDIPIPSAEYWLDGRADSAPIRVWLDGTRLPIEEIETVEQRKGNRRDELRLRCLGGIELQQRIQRVYQNRAVPDAVESLINSETTLTPNIDEPDLTQTSRTTLLDVSTADEFRESLRPVSGGEFGDSTVALEIDESSDVIRRTRSSWLWTTAPTGEADLRLVPKRGAATVTVSRAGEEQVVQWDETAQAADPGEAMVREADLPPAISHDIPDSEIGVKVRVRDVGPSKTVSEDIEVAFETTATPNAEFVVNSGDLSSTFAWVSATPKTSGFDGGLNAGDEITLVEALAVGSTEDFRYDLDAIAVYDERFGHSFDNDPTGGNGDGFETPQPFGGSADIATVTTGLEFAARTLSGVETDGALGTSLGTTGTVTTAALPGLSVTKQDQTVVSTGSGGYVPPDNDSVVLTGTSGYSPPSNDSVALTGTSTVGTTAGRARGSVALSGGGTQSPTPTQGISPQTLDRLTLTGFATPERRLLGESFDDNLQSVLGEIADLSRSLWAVEIDGPSLSLEWTRPGKRQTNDELSASAVDVERVSQRIEAATVVGGRVRREADITAVVGTPVPLPDTRIIPGTEQVRPAGSPAGRAFDQLADYELDYQSGDLTAVSDGAISDGQSLTVSYAFRPTGRFESSTFSGDARLDESIDISTATTEQQARGAAEQIVTETPDSRVESSVELGGLDPSTSVVSELSIDVLTQVAGTFRVSGLTKTPGNPTLRLGTARPLNEVVEQVERDLREVRRRV